MDSVDSSNEGGQFECRVCFEKNSMQAGSSDIFQKWSPTFLNCPTTMASEMSTLASVDICETDGHSKLICNKCFNRLCTALTFVIDVQQTAIVLKKRSQSIESPKESTKWPKPIQLDKNINEVVFGKPQGVEVKQEVISDEESEGNGADAGSMETVPMLDIKVEPEEITPQSFPFQVTVNGTISQAQHNRVSSMTNGCEVFENVEHLDSQSIKEEPMSEDEAPSDMPLECMLCANKTFRTVAGLKAHVTADHDYKGVKRKADDSTSPVTKRANNCTENQRERFICPTCFRVFRTSTDLIVHDLCHNKYRCFACNTSFSSFSEVTGHRRKCKAQTGGNPGKPKTLDDAMRDRGTKKSDEILTQPSKEIMCSICQVPFKDILYLKLHNAIEHKSKSDKSQPKNQEETKKEQNTLDDEKKTREEEKKYNQIEIELQSIFKYAVEKKEVVPIKTEKKESEQDGNARLQETLEGKLEKNQEEKNQEEKNTKEDINETDNSDDGKTKEAGKEHKVQDKTNEIEPIKVEGVPKVINSDFTEQANINEIKITEPNRICEKKIPHMDVLKDENDKIDEKLAAEEPVQQNKLNNSIIESNASASEIFKLKQPNDENVKQSKSKNENVQKDESNDGSTLCCEPSNENVDFNESFNDEIIEREANNEKVVHHESNNERTLHYESSNNSSNENIEPNDSNNENVMQSEPSNVKVQQDDSNNENALQLHYETSNDSNNDGNNEKIKPNDWIIEQNVENVAQLI